GRLRCFRWLNRFLVRDRFVGHLGLLQNSIYNLLFEHNRTDFVQLLVIFVVPGHHLFRLLIRGSHLFDQLANTRIIGLELVLLDDFSNDQTEHDATLGLLLEHLGRQLLGLDVTAELLNGLYAQTIDFVVDQRLGHLDRVGTDQPFHDLVLDLSLDGLTQFALHVLLHFGTEAFEATFLNAELGEELVIQLRQLRCCDAVDGNGELGGLAGQIEVLVILGEGRGDHALFAGLDTNQCFFEARNHATRAQHQLGALGRATGEDFTVDLADEIHVQLVVVLGCTLDVLIAGVLLAQDVQHVVDVGIGNLGLRALDLDGLEAGNLELGEYFECSDVLEVLALLEHFRLDGRRASRVQLLGNHGFIEGGLAQIAQRFLPSRRFVTLAEHAHRHPPGTETWHLGTTYGLLQTLVDFGRDALEPTANGHAALKSGGAFNRNLHGFSSLHRHKPGVPAPEWASILVARITEVTLTRQRDCKSMSNEARRKMVDETKLYKEAMAS